MSPEASSSKDELSVTEARATESVACHLGDDRCATENDSRVDTRVLVHRLVQIGILLSLVWKVSYFRWSTTIYESIPIDDPFFPEWLRSNVVLFSAYVIAVGASVIGMVTGNHSLKVAVSFLSLIGLTVLCLHQGSYNDATFTTSWWAALWTLWFVTRMTRESSRTLMPKAAFLSRVIISMILLGGAVGKWTGEYWAGQVFYDIYFVDRPFWVFNGLRSSFDAESLREIAQWYSRFVIAVETVAGLGLWLLPARRAGVVAIVFLALIALLSNFLLFSVMFSLIGLATVGLFSRSA